MNELTDHTHDKIDQLLDKGAFFALQRKKKLKKR